MMEQTSENIFRKLQPLCVDIAKEPSACRIDVLRDYVVSCKSTGTDLTALLEYIIFPLQITIRRKNITMDLKLRAISCICALLSGTVIKSFDIFREIFQNVCLMLSSNELGKVRDISEDAKEELLDCILALLKSSSQEVCEGIYSKHFMPSLGHCISLLLYIAENDKAKHLIVKATKCIKNFVIVFAQNQNENTKCFYQRQKMVSARLACFLPGISISFCKVVMGGINQGQNVIVGALEAWMLHIQVVMNDKYLPQVSSVNSVDEVVEFMSKLTTQNGELFKVDQRQTLDDNDFLVQRDNEWYSNTSSKLKLLIERLPTLVGNPNWKVHLALLQFSELVLKSCSKSLETCLPCLVEIVVGFCYNPYPQVSGKSKSLMDELQMLLANNGKCS